MKDKARRRRLPRSCSPDYSAPFIPTRDDIQEARDEIKDEWTDEQERLAAGRPRKPEPFNFPCYHGELPHD